MIQDAVIRRNFDQLVDMRFSKWWLWGFPSSLCPEDGGDMFLCNMSSVSLDYMMKYPRRVSSGLVYYPE
jgi:hypothetical protein